MQTHFSPASSSCHHAHVHHKDTPLMEVMVVVARIALAVFACMVDPVLFGVSFGVGILWGVYSACHDKKHKTSHSLEHAVGGCSEGFLEKIAGRRFPESAAFLIGGATVACHIEHHPLVFVPLVGLSVGHWSGVQFTQGAFALGRCISDLSHRHHCHAH